MKVKKAPGNTSHAKEDKAVCVAPYDAPFNKNLDIERSYLIFHLALNPTINS